MKDRHRKLIPILSILMIIAGVGILMYPALADYKNKIVQEKAITAYETSGNNLEKEEITEELRLSKEYNDNLNGTIVHEPFDPNQGYILGKEYKERLNPCKNGLMATIEIPSIDVNLPIYHGCNEDVLTRGVGHIEGTSLPIGGDATHAILSGHRGLPEATLFTYLNRLKKGDEFYIHVLDRILAYKVYDTEIIEPEELKSAKFTKGKDLVTLVTCTPYGVNSHRLLVHGERTEYNSKTKNQAVKNIFMKFNLRLAMLGVAIGVLIVVFLIYILNRRKKKTYRH